MTAVSTHSSESVTTRLGVVTRGRLGKAHRHQSELKRLRAEISVDSLRKLARRGGVKLTNDCNERVYDNARKAIVDFIDAVVRDAVQYTERDNRRTVIAFDIVRALRHKNGKIASTADTHETFRAQSFAALSTNL